MKKLIVLLLLLILVLGCTKNSALKFKSDYESLNGKESKSGKIHRTVNIDKNNPFIEISPEELLKKIEKGETFYVYFGDKLCPWCRSVIEKAIEIANRKGIKKVYYVAIWDDEGNEVLRDKYELKDNELVKTIEGTKTYYKLLEHFGRVLSNYTLKDTDGNIIETGEKRIYAPNFIYVKNGVSVKLTEGISENQKDPREELTTKILEDEEELFDNFFK